MTGLGRSRAPPTWQDVTPELASYGLGCKQAFLSTGSLPLMASATLATLATLTLAGSTGRGLHLPVDLCCAGGQTPETGSKSVDFDLLHSWRSVLLLVQHVVRAVEAQHDGLGRRRRQPWFPRTSIRDKQTLFWFTCKAGSTFMMLLKPSNSKGPQGVTCFIPEHFLLLGLAGGS